MTYVRQARDHVRKYRTWVFMARASKRKDMPTDRTRVSEILKRSPLRTYLQYVFTDRACMGSGSGPGSKCQLIHTPRAGINATSGHRGRTRTAVDFAEDAKKGKLVEWLRAKGGEAGDGPMAAAHLAQWRERGWEGDIGTRWWTTSRGSSSSSSAWWSADTRWSGGNGWGKSRGTSSQGDARWRGGK